MQEIVARTRTFRRFVQKEPISMTILHDLIDLARLGGSARNCQPWQYIIVNTPDECSKIFPFLGWAGYLKDWKGPEEGERPSAYIVCLLNRNWLKGSDREAQFDLGIASQNLLLGAMEKRIGGCRIGAFNPQIRSLFELPEHLEISLVIALGKPRETVIIQESKDEEDIQYWRDEQSVHHVPKRTLKDCLVNCSLR